MARAARAAKLERVARAARAARAAARAYASASVAKLPSSERDPTPRSSSRLLSGLLAGPRPGLGTEEHLQCHGTLVFTPHRRALGAFGTYGTQKAGTRSPYVQYGGSGA